MEYEQMARDILQAVGGKDNIEGATHCATRLRLILKDESKTDTASIDALDKVAGSVFSGGQYQIIIGTNVPQVYNTFMKVLDGSTIKEKEKTDKKQGFSINGFFRIFVEVMTPTFGVMGAAGIIKGLLALCVALGWMQSTDGAYQIWYAASDAFFYFLPIWIGINSSKHFGGSPFVGGVLAASLVYPNIISAYGDGNNLAFFGIPIVLTIYSNSLFPAMITSYIATKIELFIKPKLHESIRLMIAPLLTIIITAPLTFLVLGPVMTWISNLLSSGAMFTYNFSPILFGLVFGAFWQVIVLFGLHYAFMPVVINNVISLGQDPMSTALNVTVFALAGTAIGYALKTKDRKEKSLGLSVGITGLMGITEPILYSIAVPHRRQFIYAFIGGGLAGVLQGILNTMIYGFGSAGLFVIPLYISPEGDLSDMINFVIIVAVAFIIPIILTMIFGTGEKETN